MAERNAELFILSSMQFITHSVLGAASACVMSFDTGRSAAPTRAPFMLPRRLFCLHSPSRRESSLAPRHFWPST